MGSTSEIGRFHSDKGTEGTVTINSAPTVTGLHVVVPDADRPQRPGGRARQRHREIYRRCIERSRIQANTQSR